MGTVGIYLNKGRAIGCGEFVNKAGRTEFICLFEFLIFTFIWRFYFKNWLILWKKKLEKKLQTLDVWTNIFFTKSYYLLVPTNFKTVPSGLGLSMQFLEKSSCSLMFLFRIVFLKISRRRSLTYRGRRVQSRWNRGCMGGGHREGGAIDPPSTPFSFKMPWLISWPPPLILRTSYGPLRGWRPGSVA